MSRNGRKWSSHSPCWPDVQFSPLLWPKCSHLPKVNEKVTWSKLNPFFFSFPSRLNLNHAYSFTNSPGTCTNAAASTEKGDGSGEGISNCELSRRKGREINICGSSILWFGKVFVKLQQSHQCHHHVWMDNLHPVPLIYSATYSSHSTFFYIQLKLRKKMLDFRYTGGMNGITAQKMTKYG